MLVFCPEVFEPALSNERVVMAFVAAVKSRRGWIDRTALHF
jgi:hypothetical protein